MFQNVFNKMTKGIGKIIGTQAKYTIKGRDYVEEKLIAEGGYGYVYIVEDSMTKEKYALKKMNILDKDSLANINREVELWKKVNNCSNVVKMVDYDYTQSAVFILMELCTEGSLLDYINNKTGQISEQEALYIIKEVAAGIYGMHSQNPPVAHRDIKIENVLKFGNNYKLCDFGSASTSTLDPKKENKNTIIDQFSKFEKTTTFMYRPPEMCDQYSKFLVNEKVDVWALGCILYTVLFKKHPFQDAQKLTIISAHYYIPDEAKNYSEKIMDFIRFMLTPNPANRPSIKDVLNMIINWNTFSSIDLPEETVEIKKKQLKNIAERHGKKDDISTEDLLKAQQAIMQDLKKKSKYKKKDDDLDVKEIFDDDDFYPKSPPKKQNVYDIDPSLKNRSKSPNIVHHMPPIGGAQRQLIEKNKISNQDAWLVDFNPGQGNLNLDKNTSANINPKIEVSSDNTFGFEFCDTNLTKNTQSDSFKGFNELGNVFSSDSKMTTVTPVIENQSQVDFTFPSDNLSQPKSKSNKNIPNVAPSGQVTKPVSMFNNNMKNVNVNVNYQQPKQPQNFQQPSSGFTFENQFSNNSDPFMNMTGQGASRTNKSNTVSNQVGQPQTSQTVTFSANTRAMPSQTSATTNINSTSTSTNTTKSGNFNQNKLNSFPVQKVNQNQQGNNSIPSAGVTNIIRNNSNQEDEQNILDFFK